MQKHQILAVISIVATVPLVTGMVMNGCPDPCNPDCQEYDECECVGSDPCNPDCPEYDECECFGLDPCNPDCPEYDECECFGPGPCNPACPEYDECECLDPCEAIHPELVMPGDVMISCTASTDPSNTGSASATDNCDPAPVVTFSDSVSDGSCRQNRLITRTWTATDSCGNSTSLDQAISVTGVAGDVNGDCDADLDDYAAFEACLSGPGGGLGAGCECFDFDADGYVTLFDFAAFQASFTG